MNLLSWIIFGATVGIVFNYFDSNPTIEKLAGGITIGVLGAIVGGSLASLGMRTNMMGFGGFNLETLLAGILLSIVLVVVTRSTIKKV